MMNNKYDRDLPQDFLDAENAENRKQARNVLAAIQFHQGRKQLRDKAIRGNYIHPRDQF